MNLNDAIKLMSDQAQALRQLASGVSDDQARWKPDADSWSILEVVNHLYDEERDDFHTRLKHILDQAPGLPPDIDPEGWAVDRQYNQRDPAESLARFMSEREASLAWLKSLGDPDLSLAIELPFARMTAGDMLFAWVAHDVLHLRQLVELRYAYLKEVQAQPYTVFYGGKW